MLTGQAKKDYQKTYMKEYMRERRAVKTHDSVKTCVKTQMVPVFSKTSPVIEVPMDAGERNRLIREDMASLTLEECKAKYADVPNWRLEMG